ncbi:N-acetylmuramoyl-L-alanine amidase [Sphingomonas palmae]|uniref:N-acetylmuramoyl-L-alanine amidase n=1 Tax=Sphingomonas palmae TaxID=1855283 RepID=A0A1H7PDS5_9SPHN|nr:N-acetylmuramoyl-L-alanine amidase [Sphingomonas palmae]SEL33789.1 N-acetylmuramoyl-L-alanine amidase [Sphingomonas palmae]
MAFHWTNGRSSRHGRRVSIVLALLLGVFAGAPGWAATVERIDVSGDKVVIRFDDAVAAASSFLLAEPQRIAVDIDGARPGSIGGERDGAVTAVRQGVRGPSGARVVLDLAEPMIVDEGGFDDDARELTLHLRPVAARQFAAASASAPLSWMGKMLPVTRAATYTVSQAVPPARRELPMPKVRGDAGRPLVVIDAGHGGHDPGSISPDGQLREKDLTLKMALAVRDALLKSGRVRVALTRSDDRFLVLRERYGVARRLKADLFISIHCDSALSTEASGATAYTLSEVASDKEAARLAARENKVDIINGVDLDRNPDVSSILIDLTQRETMNASAGFARLLGREAQPLMAIKPNFHRMASLMVLKAPDTPSILLEAGYISNTNDAAFLASDEGRANVAESVRRAVEIYFARRLALR